MEVIACFSFLFLTDFRRVMHGSEMGKRRFFTIRLKSMERGQDGEMGELGELEL